MPASKLPSVGSIKSIKVEPVGGTDIVSLSYQNTDGYVATNVVQAVLDAYGRLQTKQTSYSSAQSLSFLKAQLADAEKELQEANAKIKNFQRENPYCALPGQVEELIRRRAAVEDGIKDSQSRGQEAKARVKFLESRLGVSADDVARSGETSEVLSNEVRKRLADLEFERMELSTRYRPDTLACAS